MMLRGRAASFAQAGRRACRLLCSRSAAESFPTREDCSRQARFYHQINNEALLLMASGGDDGAKAERLLREVM